MSRYQLRNLLILLAIWPPLVAFPASAKAQWADALIEHNWTVAVGAHRYGLEQTITLPGSNRKTTVYLGATTLHCPLPATTLLAVTAMTIPPILAAGALSFGNTALRFSIRDMLWLTLVVAFAVGWWLDHARSRAELSKAHERETKLAADREAAISEAIRSAKTAKVLTSELKSRLKGDTTTGITIEEINAFWQKQQPINQSKH